VKLPDHLPILDRAKRARVGSIYVERELTAPVDLCDARGRRNPAAVGFSRQPLVRANLSGHWPRKKKWNFWNWIGPDFVFSVTFCKVMEDLRWEYDASEWRKPWRVVAPHSGAIDLVLEPVVAHTPRLDLGLLATGGVCASGAGAGGCARRPASRPWTGWSAGRRSSRSAGDGAGH
jgi:hypothetical protein